MRNAMHSLLPLLVLAWTSTAQAAVPAANAVGDLRSASRHLAEAALLRNVATDRTEAGQLLAARDLLRQAEPSLADALREKAELLDIDIGRDVGVAAEAGPPVIDTPAPLTMLAPVIRSDLGALARCGKTLVQDAAVG